MTKSKTVAGLLGVFLGVFGAHRFYLRSYGLGILYFVFCWTLIPGLIGFVEGIQYLRMDEDRFIAKYSQKPASTKDADSRSVSQSSPKQTQSEQTNPSVEVTVSMGGGGGGTFGEDLDTDEKIDQSVETWVPPGEAALVNGYDIPDGMVYIGTELSPVEGFQGTDGCLIDPTLQVESTRLDWDGERMGYWPSYSEIDAGCRATYLEWLADGRRDPDIDIGYVFLFFYGIERRVLFDARHSSQARSEVPALLNEVEELLEVYGEESSFPGYASRFLNAARARYDPESLTSNSSTQGRGMPLGARVKLGRQITSEELVDDELAYEWFLQAPNTYLRTPAERCEEEFKILFTIRYRERFDEGVSLELDATPLTVSYNPASRSIPQQEDVEIEGVPDIAELSAPQEQFQELANKCCDELDSYSRYVGKSGERDSLEALSYLPEPVLEQRDIESLTAFLETIESELDEAEMVETTLDRFLEQWPVDSDAEVRERELRQLAILLEKLGFGIEPDVRFSAPSRGWGDPAVLYRLPSGAKAETSAVSEAIRLIQKLAVKIALSNDEVASEQTEYLAENLGSFLELDEVDQARLEAHRRWLILDSPTLHGVRQRAEDLPADQKPQIARFLTALACSDGSIDAEEIAELSKIYPMLGLDEDMVHTHLHQLQTQPKEADNEPVTIREPASTTEEYEIPEPDTTETDQSEDLELDQDRVNRTLEESKEVSEFLADIFEDDDEEEDKVDAADETQPDTHDVGSSEEETTGDLDNGEATSLDADHQEFLVTLSEKERWDRGEVEAVAQDLGLFPGAAIDVINDHAFEQVETQVIEGTDDITVNQELASKIIE
ncbi:TerB N-terminal domain-containing protein [Halosimplex pelagicum]|uniref:TerB N-terminal domain-containing protein n=1 Tax=Halosimplex pelagicum TaxID=869886 RepID=A0A7D5P917_9EURY|nr:TerB N-terminal domain-containing protein [Halosimplex pelagicum]QLH83806.1 TerB N-terminal domain-containing protein [Halosimplex pelagicum]